MDNEEKHYPLGVEPEQTPPAAEPTNEETPTADPSPEESVAAEETTPAADDKKADEEPKPQPVNKRSIYEEYKDKKQEAKGAKEAAAAAEQRATAAETKAAELQALLDAKADAKTPEEKSEAADDIKEFAEKQGLDPDGLQQLIDIVEKRIGKPALPADIQRELDANRAFRESHEAQARRTAEDQEIRDQSDAIKAHLKELGSEVHDQGEFATVMDEIVRLSHTKDFHDKEIGYIVWAKRAELAKLISPKKPSFESQSANRSEGETAKVDFKGGRVTPMQAQAAMSEPRPTYEITRPRT